MSVSDYRNNLASTFDRVDRGERVLIRRKARMYTIVPIEEDQITVTKELQNSIDRAMEDYRRGDVTRCETPEDVRRLFESLR